MTTLEPQTADKKDPLERLEAIRSATLRVARHLETIRGDDDLSIAIATIDSIAGDVGDVIKVLRGAQ
mgnify:CR=1 FL=1